MSHTEFDIIAQYYDLLYEDRLEDIPMWQDLAEAAKGPILELGCGTGRILLPLLQAGYQVDGIDIADVALAACRAKIKAGGFEKQSQVYQADMRNLVLSQKAYALIFSPINTFMHNLNQDDQLATLQAIYQHLKPGGLVVLDLYHPQPQLLAEADGRLQFVEEFSDQLTGNTVQWYSTRHLDLSEQIQDVTFMLDEIGLDSQVRRQSISFSMRYLHRFEVELLLKICQFQVRDVWGDYDMSPFNKQSPRMIYLAEKS